ncbi:GNAT family N-acetyltransferase [Quadrisphaera setariae]|uniref:GNAT family N-acetyltransferase n=1 Tax=Quadrisphaera setariae TaxID=2593304 RepID=A0A5C8Z7N3_9ACTN|nr:GNAT family N-acetyltransferase [Quadrisphaera setariae]TXR52866.1 GNAT family N-acetyltransferase [Quadrisphaera setariae]
MAHPDLATRPATVDDAAGIARVHVLGWQVGYRELLPGSFLAELSAPGALERRTTTWAGWLDDGADVTVAVDGEGRVLAFCSCGPSRDEDAAEGTGEVYALYADPDAWGAGAGFAAHRGVLRRVAERGFEAATLWVLEGNTRARQFYERQGWVLDTAPGSRKTEEIGGAELAEVRYRRDLTSAGR